MGGGPQGRRQPRLRAVHSAKGESRSVRGEDRKQRRGAVAAAVGAGVLHDHPGLARETNSRLGTGMIGVDSPSMPAPLRLAFLGFGFITRVHSRSLRRLSSPTLRTSATPPPP